MNETTKTYELKQLWEQFKWQFNINEKQLYQFKEYSLLLRKWNKNVNLTAITDPEKIISNHFQDSIIISKFLDFNKLSMLADVGSGAGFPVIPIKICFPHLSIVLIEVIQKKILFLKKAIEALNLSDVEVSSYDWRTFLRKTEYPIDLFCARASLSVKELVRIFSPNCVYSSAQIVYWASSLWQVPASVQPFVYRQKQYSIDKKQRRYVFLKASNE